MLSFRIVNAIVVLMLITGTCRVSSADSTNLKPNQTADKGLVRLGLRFEPGAIASACRANTPPATRTEIGDQLEKLIRDFSSAETRINSPEKFVAEIDAVLAKTRLAPILKCREQLNNSQGFAYALQFQDPARGNLSMKVTTEKIRVGSTKKLKKILKFNLVKSVEKVLFVYLHELMHVCQAPELEEFYSRYDADPQNLDFKGDVYRQRLLGEIEAYLVMNLAYTELVKYTPSLCVESGSTRRPTISEEYLESENALLNGSFAQTIISAYAETFKGHEEYILDQGKFSLGKLNPKMKSKVETLGIFVNDDF
jgi:hypothetical protein